MELEFGVFDHVDRNHLPLPQFYEDRLRLVEAYDRAGIRSYHCAEHHFTPLGMAASPSVFLSAVAQRTKRLRFGPLVYTLALYHPLRLAEEICMLDQMSEGRFELGVGKGISPIEIGYYGVEHAKAGDMFAEALKVVLQALEHGRVDFEGAFYRFRDTPFVLGAQQRPHPPLWYGVVNPDSAGRAGKQGMSFISNSAPPAVRAQVAAWRAAFVPQANRSEPRLGMNRYLVLADSDAEALEIGRRAYRVWHESFHRLWTQHGTAPVNVVYPPEIDGQIADGRALAGTPETVFRALSTQLAETGVNYMVCRFAFGDLTLAESRRSLDLFATHVMPGLREQFRKAAI